MTLPRVLLAQLPIPPAGPEPIVGNVPLAAGYLILYARSRGLHDHYDFEMLPPAVANCHSDVGIVQAILQRAPWMVGFSCYLWNIDRTLWIAAELKRLRPEMLVVLGGPEITADNAWVLESTVIDFAVIGEGEQTFSELLDMLRGGDAAERRGTLPVLRRGTDGDRRAALVVEHDDGRLIQGLWRASNPQWPLFRKPLANLDEVSSPYLNGLLNAADEKMLLLETIRGCVFKCKFCYYPKSYDALYFVSEEKIVANLRHAQAAEVKEVILLDPTLNQRPDFNEFLRLLARENPGNQFQYFGELRAEGIKPETAQLLRAANFTEVEIGLQSLDPAAQALMDRKNNMKAFERGVGAMLDAGIQVKVDLIIGLPGDTVDSVRRGYDYLSSSKLFSSMQVFNLAILPGTAFRQEATQLGLEFQSRPPYYVLNTPTLTTEDLYTLMADAQEAFDTEWDPFPEPKLEFDSSTNLVECIRLNVDTSTTRGSLPTQLPEAAVRAQALTLWFESEDFSMKQDEMQQVIRQVLSDSPHSTLQIILEPSANPAAISADCIGQLLEACYSHPNYLDRYYSLNPQGLLGSKRVLVKIAEEIHTSDQWIDEMCALP